MTVGNDKIWASALVYCRTYYRDYDAGFLLRPDDFTDETVRWARPYISSAVSYCDEMKGIRRVVFGDEKHLIFGVAGILRDLPGEVPAPFTTDEYGRNIKCFLGFVCLMEEKRCGYFPLVEDFDYKKIFSDYIANDEVWKNRMPQHIPLGYDIYSFSMTQFNGNTDFQEKKVSVSRQEDDESLFKQALSQISPSDWQGISLCTNMYNLKMMQEAPYAYMTAGENIVKKYGEKQGKTFRQEDEQAEDSINDAFPEHSPPQEVPTGENIETDQKGNQGFVPIICGIVAVVIIIFLAARGLFYDE